METKKNKKYIIPYYELLEKFEIKEDIDDCSFFNSATRECIEIEVDEK